MPTWLLFSVRSILLTVAGVPWQFHGHDVTSLFPLSWGMILSLPCPGPQVNTPPSHVLNQTILIFTLQIWEILSNPLRDAGADTRLMLFNY